MSEHRSARAALTRTDQRQGARRHRRRIMVALASVLSGVLVIAAFASVFVGGLARSFQENASVIANPFPKGTARPAPTTTAAMNILLIGSDSRASDPDTDDGFTGGRSDTLMLAHIPADRHGVYLMSIMRDSWVNVPGHGDAKINAAYSWGGIPLTVQTVEKLLDVRIDHVAEIDFAGFKGMTDALGGVTVQSSKAFVGQGGKKFAAGPNRLHGVDALKFVRERHAFADADYTRVRNQQAFMGGLLDAVTSNGTLTNPARLQRFVTATSKYLSVDDGLDFQALVALGMDYAGEANVDLHTFTMPTAGGGVSSDGQSYVAVNTVEVQELSSALRSDDVAHWLATEDE